MYLRAKYQSSNPKVSNRNPGDPFQEHFYGSGWTLPLVRLSSSLGTNTGQLRNYRIQSFIEIRCTVSDKMSMSPKTTKSSCGCPSVFPMSISTRYSNGNIVLSINPYLDDVGKNHLMSSSQRHQMCKWARLYSSVCFPKDGIHSKVL